MKETTKIYLYSLFIYPAGALIWGLLCLYSGIININEFYHIFTSYVVLLIPIFFFINYFVIKHNFKIIDSYIENKNETILINCQKSIKLIPFFITFLVILWGFIGPVFASLTLYFPKMGFILKEKTTDVYHILLMTMNGFACSFLIFIPFILLIFSNIEKYAKPIPISNDSLLSIKTKLRVSDLFTIIGTIFLLVSSGLSIIIGFKESDNFIRILVEKVSVISIIAIIISIINTSFTIKQILTPIDKLKNVMLEMFRNIKEGDIDLTKNVEIATRDELSLVINYFNDFFSFMRKIIHNFRDLTLKTKELSLQVSSGSQQSTVSLEEMKKIIENMRNLILNLNEKIGNSSNSSNEIKNFLINLNTLINNQSSSINESSAALEEMAASIANVKNISEDKQKKAIELENIANTGEENMKETMNNITNVTNSVNIIMEMIQVINDIAGKTNLLSMNAAIEAAHAGDYGKGFSIVADEIRGLAESVSKNSSEITKSVDEVITFINQSGSTTDKTAKSLIKIVDEIKNFSTSLIEMKNAMDEIAIGSSEIMQGLNSIVDVTGEIKNSSKSIVEKTENINDIIISLKNVSSETKNGMEEIQSGINEIYKGVEIISKASTENEENVEVLSKFISNIKI